MSIGQTTASECQVLVGGAPLSPLVSMYLYSVEVDTSMFVPSQVKITFRSRPDTVLEDGGLQLAVPIVVTVPLDGAPVPIFTGEVTAVEIEGDAYSYSTIVKGMDMGSRLMRGTITMAYPEALASDVVATLLGECAVPPGEVIETTTIYPVLSQANVSPWTFIQQLARMENYVAFCDAEGLFNFRPMPLPEEGDPPAVSYEAPAGGTQLVMGKNLRRFRATVTSAEQVPSVVVGAYDPEEDAPLLGIAFATPSTAVPLDPATEPVAVSGEFDAKPFFDSSRPFTTVGAAETWANSIATDLAGALAEIEAECNGNPALLAGAVISVGMAGPPFEGNFVCTSARHIFDPNDSGYVTWVTVGGYRDRSTFALSSGMSPTDTLRPTIPGLVSAKVTNVEDPLEMGRVQLLFPWLDPDFQSGWARVMQIGASEAGTGFTWFPEVGDEVLVGFDRGSIDYPFVIGNLYNGVARAIPAPEWAPRLMTRAMTSGLGHVLAFVDDPETPGILLGTTPADDPPLSLKMDAEEATITIDSAGKITITGIADITITSEASLTLAAPTITIGNEETATVSIGGDTVSVGSLADEISVGGGSTSVVVVNGAAIALGGG